MHAHQSVLLNECIDGLALHPNGVYIDGTFGRGGHSRELLKHLSDAGRLYAIDKDLEAISHGKANFSVDHRVHLLHGSFADLYDLAVTEGIVGKVNGILLDLGVSSPQLDNPERGFSFMQDGPLDMRMDTSRGMSAAEYVNSATPEDMAEVFKMYGEERFSGRIARAIVQARIKAPITRTLDLAEIVKEANPKWEKHKHPATRVFQAIRIYVNQELEDLKRGLEQSLEILAPQGRLVVISFHSLEDRIVKQFMRNREEGERPPPGVPIRYEALQTDFKRVGKAIKPGEAEVRDNVRARSAVLRIGEKLS
jgi:16S rRNA (cytosine1402-N4)-methyltransferase